MKCVICKGSDIKLTTVDEQIRTRYFGNALHIYSFAIPAEGLCEPTGALPEKLCLSQEAIPIKREASPLQVIVQCVADNMALFFQQQPIPRGDIRTFKTEILG